MGVQESRDERPFFYSWAVLLLLSLIAYERVTSNADKVSRNEEIGRQIERLSPLAQELAEQNRARQVSADKLDATMVRLTRWITALTVIAALAGVVGAYAALKAG